MTSTKFLLAVAALSAIAYCQQVQAQTSAPIYTGTHSCPPGLDRVGNACKTQSATLAVPYAEGGCPPGFKRTMNTICMGDGSYSAYLNPNYPQSCSSGYQRSSRYCVKKGK